MIEKIIYGLLMIILSYYVVKEFIKDFIDAFLFDPSKISFRMRCDEMGCGEVVVCSGCDKSIKDPPHIKMIKPINRI